MQLTTDIRGDDHIRRMLRQRRHHPLSQRIGHFTLKQRIGTGRTTTAWRVNQWDQSQPTLR